MIRVKHEPLNNVFLVYNLCAKDNMPWMLISSVEYTCVRCGKCAYIDLEIVPPCDIQLECGGCSRSLTFIQEQVFQVKLVPIFER
jgi:hypothetical protein